ncbi:DUF3990 domain-containing protein [Butyrivibrio sp. VCD2006]|uniref:DUF3990 domain-containing protein n=1 Tax=Butyrivibrio sp. VCD2006 TaxID=1280664 RepID=UPI0004154EBB|nr:DUF3990 domain-containing protein [Butyrivibrio sp. VCD2006]
MKVYHGSIEVVKAPDVLHSSRALDFGKGFYVTTVKEQAEKWAKRKADLYDKPVGVINEYEMKTDKSGFIEKTFTDDLGEWIDFVCNCRDGGDDYLKYDLISGKVANDKVFRVVDMYHQGIWDKERALKEIKVYETYDQIAFVSQKAIDQLLSYVSYYEV